MSLSASARQRISFRSAGIRSAGAPPERRYFSKIETSDWAIEKVAAYRVLSRICLSNSNDVSNFNDVTLRLTDLEDPGVEDDEGAVDYAPTVDEGYYDQE